MTLERSCARCGRPLPGGSRPQRRTCSVRCRVAMARGVEPARQPSSDRPVAPMAAPAPVTLSPAALSLAATIPTPVEPGSGACRAYVGRPDGQDSWQAYFATDQGRGRTFAGPPFARLHRCLELVAALNARL